MSTQVDPLGPAYVALGMNCLPPTVVLVAPLIEQVLHLLGEGIKRISFCSHLITLSDFSVDYCCFPPPSQTDVCGALGDPWMVIEDD